MGCCHEAHRPSPLPRPPKRCCASPNRHPSWHKVPLHHYPETSSFLTPVNRTDKKQHFSEKVTKVESILAADGKVDKKTVEAKPVASEEQPKKAIEETAEPKEAKPVEVKQPSTPGTNKGTWASMFKK
jgi:hypothetical protein